MDVYQQIAQLFEEEWRAVERATKTHNRIFAAYGELVGDASKNDERQTLWLAVIAAHQQLDAAEQRLGHAVATMMRDKLESHERGNTNGDVPSNS